MCGIAGYVRLDSGFSSKNFVIAATKSLHHRGPDENGAFVNDAVCLLNTRLSIIDVSNGHQPIYNERNNLVVVQNGEIYNFLEIREKLISTGVEFKTKSDTEVILRAYETHGNECFAMFNGMFAIAIFDEINKKVVIARDRLGVKPLYFFEEQGSIFFSSEIKTFLDIESFGKEIDEQSIHNYLKFNYIPLPRTIFKNVFHLEPGTYREISTVSLASTTHKYWDIENLPEVELSQEDIFSKMDEVLINAIKIRLRSDVEVGAFLSGGLDSSLVCAMTKHHFDVSLNSFSIGFPEKRFDESEWARKVAAHCDIPNRVHVLDSDIISLWEKTTWHNDQPHGDISFIPTYVLSQFAAEEFKVVLTGDGGDEACAGYTKYFGIQKHDMSQYFDSISLIKDDRVFTTLYTSSFLNKVDLKIPKRIFNETISKVSKKDDINKVLYFDIKQLLPGNNLVKPDKMGMAHSLEARSPLLDYRFFELMQSIPGKMKLTETETKEVLKQFSLKYLPHDVVYRNKQMFTVPVGEWFKTKLKNFLTEIIFSDSLASRKIFNIDELADILQSHLDGTEDFTRELRAIVNLEIWFREFID